MAKLHFHYGTMSSSKSANLLINNYNQGQTGNKTEIIKPKIDNRFGDECVTSRIGLSAPAKSLSSLAQYWPRPDTHMLFVDEVQFFSPADVDRLVRIADDTPTIVMCYGLVVDSNEQMFPAARRLIEVGAKLHRMESTCQIQGCKRLATHHLRYDAAGNIIRAGEQICVGDTNFKSVCRQHFNQLYHGLGLDEKGGR